MKIATQSYCYWVCAELTKAFDFLPLIIFLELPLVTGSCKSREQLQKTDSLKNNRPDTGEEVVTARNGKLRWRLLVAH